MDFYEVGEYMRILFCDDNPEITATLQSYVGEYFRNIGGVEPEYAAYDSGDCLLRNEQKADIAFLDVEMPGLSGIYVGAKLKEYNPYIKIFIITSYPDYLDEAMRFQVFRYLSKPIDKGRLFRNLKDAMYQYNLDTREYAILTEQGLFVKRADEIVCVEAQQRKCIIHTTKEILVSTETMAYWKQMLSLPCFYAPHKSFVINMRFVSEIQKDSILLRFKGKEKEAYLARRKFTQFKDTYLLYLESVQ